MQLVCRSLVALAVAGFLAGPLYADVIPSRREAQSDAADKVQARLVEMGLTADAARAHARELTAGELSYFAQNPHRLQWAGQELWAGQSDNFWWEWLFGIGALVGVGVGYYFFAIANDD
jgi:hypothetical protein